MRRKYRGFRGEVAPLTPGLGWLPRTDTDGFYFCGREDYSDYVSKHGAPPAGSAILGTGMGFPQMCIDAGYSKQYVYGTGNILQTRITGPGTTQAAPPPPPPPPTYAPTAPAPTVAPTAPGLPTMPPGTDPDQWAFDLWRTGHTTGPDPRIAQEAARQGELETRQAAEGGDGTYPELESRAAVQEATRRAIEGGGHGPGEPAAGAPVAEKKPNWLPLIIGAVTIYLMQ